MANIICGVDVSSQVLDARIGFDGAARRFERTAEGIAALADFCRQHAVELVVLEATGGYEKLPFMLLWAAGVPSAIVNPRSVRRFAEGMGLLEKTDRIDCGVIAWYAAVKRIVPREPPAEAQQRLTALVCRLRQLTELLVMQINQRRLICDGDAIGSIDAVIARPNPLPLKGRAIAYGRNSRISEHDGRVCSWLDSSPFSFRFHRLSAATAICDCPALKGERERRRRARPLQHRIRRRIDQVHVLDIGGEPHLLAGATGGGRIDAGADFLAVDG